MDARRQGESSERCGTVPTGWLKTPRSVLLCRRRSGCARKRNRKEVHREREKRLRTMAFPYPTLRVSFVEEGTMRKLLTLLAILALTAPLAFYGCGSGDTGPAGATGATGATGAAGATAPRALPAPRAPPAPRAARAPPALPAPPESQRGTARPRWRRKRWRLPASTWRMSMSPVRPPMPPAWRRSPSPSRTAPRRSPGSPPSPPASSSWRPRGAASATTGGSPTFTGPAEP